MRRKHHCILGISCPALQTLDLVGGTARRTKQTRWARDHKRRRPGHRSIDLSSQRDHLDISPQPLWLPKTQIRAVSSTKDRLHNNVSEPLNRAGAGCVLAKRKVRPHLIIVAGVFHSSWRISKECAEGDLRWYTITVVPALVPRRTDQALNSAVLPGRAVRRRPIPNTYRSDANSSSCSNAVATSTEIDPFLENGRHFEMDAETVGCC